MVKMMTQPDDSEGPQAADVDSTDSRPAPLKCPESRNTDDEIQVSFSHAELASNLNERFTQYRERTKSHIQNSQDSDEVGRDQDGGMVPLTPRPPQIGVQRGASNLLRKWIVSDKASIEQIMDLILCATTSAPD